MTSNQDPSAPYRRSWIHSLMGVALGVMMVAFVITLLSVYFQSFLLGLLGGLMLFSALISFLSMNLVTVRKKGKSKDE